MAKRKKPMELCIIDIQPDFITSSGSLSVSQAGDGLRRLVEFQSRNRELFLPTRQAYVPGLWSSFPPSFLEEFSKKVLIHGKP